MSKLRISAIAMLAAAAMASPALAQSFNFTTSGCFYFGSGGCSDYLNVKVLPGSDNNGTYTMTYTGVSVTGTANATGLLSPLNLGALTFTSTNPNNSYYWDKLNFNMRVNFSAPTTAPNSYTFVTTLNGSVQKEASGNFNWSFSPDNALFTYGTTGLFRMTVDSKPEGGTYVNSAPLTGNIQCLSQTSNGDGSFYANAACAPYDQAPPIKNSLTNVVPEPSTYALMASGLAGLLILSRRRRNNA